MTDTVKLIIEIPKTMYENVQNGTYCGTLYKELKNGIPLDDVKAEVFRQSKQTNETFSPEWNDGFNDGMFHTLTIIRDYFKHIAESEDKE